MNDEQRLELEQRLEQASLDNRLVRVYEGGITDGWTHGYVVGTGTDFFALEVISDGIRFDGCDCRRYVDVDRCEVPDPNWKFLEKALELRGLRRRGFRELDLSSPSSILRTASEMLPVVRIFQEDPDVCYVGSVHELGMDQVDLRTVSPDGAWGEVESFDLGTITRIGFGSAYEESLVLVADATEKEVEAMEARIRELEAEIERDSERILKRLGNLCDHDAVPKGVRK